LQPDTQEEYTHCLHCDGNIALESRFCKHCGAAHVKQETIPEGHGWAIIQQSALFYGIALLLCCLASFIDAFKTLTWSVIFDVLLACVTLTFFCDGWVKNKHLLRVADFSVIKLLGYGALASLASVVVSYCVGWLNHTLFSDDFYYYGLYSGSKYAPLLMIFFTAIMPALFEELGFRGYLLQNLLKVTDKTQAIFISSFLFAILHLSFLSLFWLIPFALVLGYVRVKEKTLWYGVFMHFCFNLTVCIMEIIKYG